MSEPGKLARTAWLIGGLISVALGTIGIALPLLPTVPFYILAAFCFARSNRAWEQRLLDHPKFGPSIRAWRERRIISRKGKVAATLAFAVSIALGAISLPWPWSLLPALVALICLSWLWSQREA